MKFDTLKLMRRLKEAGMPEDQAEAITESVSEVLFTSDVATVHDLKEMEVRLEYKVEHKIESHIQAAKADMIKWTAGMLLAQTGLMAGLMTAILKLIP